MVALSFLIPIANSIFELCDSHIAKSPSKAMISISQQTFPNIA